MSGAPPAPPAHFAGIDNAARVAFKSPVPKDIDVSQAIAPLPITRIAESLGVLPEELEAHGPHKAKVTLGVIERLKAEPDGNYVVVTGINPTPLGEGKSTTTVGVGQALGAVLGRPVVTCIRQPSLGPTFGIKGGAAGGGYSQVVPMEEFNLHLTGDIHAVTAANNLLAAAIDTRLYHEDSQSDEGLFARLCPKDAKTGELKPFSPVMRRRLRKLGIDDAKRPEELDAGERARFARLAIDRATITWKRVGDVCDRHLRGVTVGTGPKEVLSKSGAQHSRETGFDLTVASEIMAVLALTTSLADMRERLGAMVVARSSRDGAAVTADDLGCGGALTVLMRDAIMPTLMQTVEATPVLVHAGPFANIAHGNSSVVADQIALKLVGRDGFVVTEAGFGADIGGEKFMNIKCRASGRAPDAVINVATVRALKTHGGGPPIAPGAPLAREYCEENLELLRAGCCNMEHHVKCLSAKYGVRTVVAVNRFHTDTDAEIALVIERARAAGAFAAVEANHWACGGAGAAALAAAVADACAATKADAAPTFKYLYPDDASIKEKVAAIATQIYNAGAVEYSELAEGQIAAYTAAGYDKLPVCIAKTQYSLACDPKLKGVPSGHTVTVREVRASVGAGFLYLLCGDIMTVPGLATRPGFYDVDIDTETGKVVGLF